MSWLYYADRLMELPAGVLGVAVGTILLPSLSKYHADANHAEYARLLDWGLRITVLLAVPAAAALAVLALPLVATLFQYGRFSAGDVVDDAPGAGGLQRRPGRHDPGENPRAGLLRAAERRDAGEDRHPDAGRSRRRMNFAFVGPLKHAGLALAIGLGACLNAFLLFYSLKRKQIYVPQPGWLAFTAQGRRGRGGDGAVLFTRWASAAWWLDSGWQRRVPAVMGLVVLGAAVYAACLAALGLRPRDFSRRGAA